jgi:hypothetical protein
VQPQIESTPPISRPLEPKIGIGKPNVAASWPIKAKQMASRDWRFASNGELHMHVELKIKEDARRIADNRQLPIVEI